MKTPRTIEREIARLLELLSNINDVSWALEVEARIQALRWVIQS